jgi:hypothetical protein
MRVREALSIANFWRSEALMNTLGMSGVPVKGMRVEQLEDSDDDAESSDVPPSPRAMLSLPRAITVPEAVTLPPVPADTSPWQQIMADDGRIYYWNTATNETSWTPPAK